MGRQILLEAPRHFPWGWAVTVGVLIGVGVIVLPRHQDIPAPTPISHARGQMLRIPAAPNGHFYVTVVARGARFRMLVDTGATIPVFSIADAARMGFDTRKINWNGWSSTANGVARSASIKVDLIVAGVLFSGVEAAIGEGAMGDPLLGVSFLNSLTSFHAEHGVLTLTF